MVIVAVLILVTLFAAIAVAASAEEPGRRMDLRDDPLFWATFGRR